MSSRRNLLKNTLLTSAAAGSADFWAHSTTHFDKPDKNAFPVVIATWGPNVKATAAAWEVLVRDGRALDAVEAGVRVPEADPNDTSVGYGGLPDRDGFVTILTGALHGDKLAGTVIVDSPVNPPERAHHGPPHREIRPHRVYPTLAEALARFRLAPEQPCENTYIVDFIARHSLLEVDGGWTWKFDPSIWTRFSIGDTAERLRSTKCRIAIMRGEMSVLMPPEVGEYMFSLLGHAAPVIEIPQARHHVMLDQPLAFVAALRALLADWNHSMPTRRV